MDLAHTWLRDSEDRGRRGFALHQIVGHDGRLAARSDQRHTRSDRLEDPVQVPAVGATASRQSEWSCLAVSSGGRVPVPVAVGFPVHFTVEPHAEPLSLPTSTTPPTPTRMATQEGATEAGDGPSVGESAGSLLTTAPPLARYAPPTISPAASSVANFLLVMISSRMPYSIACSVP